ncbi:putative integral membrane protein [Hoeflea sp. IMCC20628]|uniref:anthrone oxygenase family protein n=1 Tax=Hoeflea sp. IMCC20628 TaxID=1620421 RepID=UPI00063AB167|nr:anthrone oxygenase family protein [Hoeflea sp. IMCC20628]AKI01235.1 putative integral membrane protein [Hoeflea sp. IMCC20628]
MISTRILPLVSLLLVASIFGFFYAWVCSTMWGLDASDPSIAIQAMQAMNASVRNTVFFPAFFLTPVVLAITAAALIRTGRRDSGLWFGLATVVYGLGGFGVTVVVNVPMNEALALIELPLEPVAAEAVWRGYSSPWQVWNQVRALACGAAVLLTGMGLLTISPVSGSAAHART